MQRARDFLLSGARQRVSRTWRRNVCVASASLLLAGSASAQAAWKLIETLRIGGAETGPLAFVYTKSIEADAKGRILVLDRKSQDIRVFAADGKLARVIGRVGSGPGEFRDAEGIVVARDGTLWVRDAANARFSLFDAEGVFQANWTMKFCMSQGAWTPQSDQKGRILDVDCLVSGGQALKEAVLAYHRDRSRVDTLAFMPACGDATLKESGMWITKSARGTRYQSIPYAARALTALGLDGEVWCVPSSSRYEILRLASAAHDTTRITRSAAPVPVTPAERDSIIDGFESKGPSGLDFSRIPKEKPALDRLTVDDQGRLWVRHTTAKGALAFDIFSTNGRIIATAEMRGCRTSVWQPFVVRGENVYTVCYDEDDVQFITRFRIARGL